MNRDRFRDWLLGRLAALAGIQVEVVSTDEPFSAYGLDSVRLSALAHEIEQLVGQEINVTVLYEFPTVSRLVDAICSTEAPEGRPPTRSGAVSRIAIIGLACRMPGAPDADSFWELLARGVDAITEIPVDRDPARWHAPDPSDSGRAPKRWGGFIDGVQDFDATFFRIPPEEALRMDPQQRLLLEVCWEALEDAGLVPARYRGSRTGVYVGISVSEYGNRQLRDRLAIGPHTPTGNSLAIAANRISYAFDLHGPSVAVDTACSSSLVAVHLACQAIRAGECDAAIVGGVNVLLDPEITIGLDKAGMLAPDGRCKPFDARANGYVRGEGCAVVILKPLDSALAAGDRVYAVIRGSAVNQDGATNGLTAPNPAAQRAVLRAAYLNAAIDPTSAQYIECHGTGTYLGDPIEALSLGSIVGVGRPPGHFCLIGSVKSNIGHLEPAAGIAAIVKVALSLQHALIPPSLHFETPNPQIPFEDLGLRVASAPLKWDGLDRIAGVSSFGFGGTNAHIVVEGAPPQPEPRRQSGPISLLVSARTGVGLDRVIRSWADRLENAPIEQVAALAYTAAVRHTHHRPFRAAFTAEDAPSLVRTIRVAADRSSAVDQPSGAPFGTPRVAFVFSGQGTQWPGMMRGLLDSNPLFRSAIRRSDEALIGVLPWSIERVLRGDTDCNLDDTAVAQPVLVAVQLGLVAVWRSLGIQPTAVVGHSVGEVSAAVTAGLLDFGSGLRLAVRRGRVMGTGGGDGRMLAVGIGREEAKSFAAQAADVDVAAINGPAASVLAGDSEELARIRSELLDKGGFARFLSVDYAFHSRRMQAPSNQLIAELGELPIGQLMIPFYSTLFGRKVADGEIDSGYWARSMRGTVDFAAAVSELIEDGVDALLELSPDPALRGPMQQLTKSSGRPQLPVLHSIQKDQEDRRSVIEVACRLYSIGCDIRWEHLLTVRQPVVSLPRHPWQRGRYWIEPREAAIELPTVHTSNPFLGSRLDLAQVDGRLAWLSTLTIESIPCLGDHRVGGVAVLPVAGYLDLAHAAAVNAGLSGCVILRSLKIHHPLALDDEPTRIQTTLTPDRDGRHKLMVHTRPSRHDRKGAWILVATAEIGALPANEETRQGVDLASVRRRCSEEVSAERLYQLLAAEGLDYGPSFRGVQEVRRRDGEAIGTVAAPEDSASPGTANMRLLDAAFHVAGAAASLLSYSSEAASAPIPVAIESVTWWSSPELAVTVHAATRRESGSLTADVSILKMDGSPVVELKAIKFRRSLIQEQQRRDEGSLLLYETQWRQRKGTIAAPSAQPSGLWLVLGGRSAIGARLVEGLRQLGVESVKCVDTNTSPEPAKDELAVDLADPASYEHMLNDLMKETHQLSGIVQLLMHEQPIIDQHHGDDDQEEVTRTAKSLMFLLRALSLMAEPPPRIVVASTGCQAVDNDGLDLRSPFPAIVWGLLKTAAMENPLLSVTCVDLDASPDPMQRLLTEIVSPDREIEVAWRHGTRFVRRIVEVGPEGVPQGDKQLALNSAASYVVTGGTGGLGLLVARRLAERGACHIALIARGTERPGLHTLLEALGKDGVDVQVIRANVAHRQELLRALESIRSTGYPIRGILHAAGLLDDRPLVDLNEQSLNTVLQPKVLGGWNLHQLTAADALDWFVLFSSAASLLGSPGQAAYSAANAFLDALAHFRRQRGLPATTINWGPWAGAGMASERSAAGKSGRLRTGVGAIDPAKGLDILERVLASNRIATVVLPFDLRDLIQYYPASHGLSFFEEITTQGRGILERPGGHRSSRPPLATPYVAPRNRVEARIVAIWQKSLGIEPIGVLDGFFELGGDSVFGNQVLLEINRALGVRIKPQEAFQKLTVERVSAIAEEQMVARLGRMSDVEAHRIHEELAAGTGHVTTG